MAAMLFGFIPKWDNYPVLEREACYKRQRRQKEEGFVQTVISTTKCTQYAKKGQLHGKLKTELKCSLIRSHIVEGDISMSFLVIRQVYVLCKYSESIKMLSPLRNAHSLYSETRYLNKLSGLQ